MPRLPPSSIFPSHFPPLSARVSGVRTRTFHVKPRLVTTPLDPYEPLRRLYLPLVAEQYRRLALPPERAESICTLEVMGRIGPDESKQAYVDRVSASLQRAFEADTYWWPYSEIGALCDAR